MKISEFSAVCGFEMLVPPTDETREVSGIYACDLLSWVIGRAKEGAALVTMMTNVNVIAVAVMADLPCVILTEGVTPDAVAVEKAKQNGIAVLSSKLPTYETCVKVGSVL